MRTAAAGFSANLRVPRSLRQAYRGWADRGLDGVSGYGVPGWAHETYKTNEMGVRSDAQQL